MPTKKKISVTKRASTRSALSPLIYVLLLTIKGPDERSFYEIEATSESWSVPELKRQVEGLGTKRE